VHLPAPERARFLDVNRTRLRLWEWGDESAPAAVCVHGAYDHGRMWDWMAPRLADLGFRVVAPDLRGHGDSGRLGSGEMWAASALDLALLARELGPPVGMIGHSFGAGQAMFTGGVWPELVRWVVNLDGLGQSDPPEERSLAERAADSWAAAERVLLRPPRVYASLEEMVERRGSVNGRLPTPWVEHLVRHGARPAEGGFVWKSDPMFSVGTPGEWGPEYEDAELALLTRPLLVLTGAEPDTWSEMSPAQIDERMALFDNARHSAVDGAGHYVHIEQPEIVLAAVSAFITEVAP